MQESLKFLPKRHSSAKHCYCSTGHSPLCCLFHFFCELNKEPCFENPRMSAASYFMSEGMSKWSPCSQWVLTMLRQSTHLTPRSGRGCWAGSWPPWHLCHQMCSPAQSSSPAPGASPPALNLEPLQKGDKETKHHYSMPRSPNIHKQKEGVGGFSVSSFKATQPLQQEFSYILWYRRQDSAQTAMLCLHRHAKDCLLFQLLYFLDNRIESHLH